MFKINPATRSLMIQWMLKLWMFYQNKRKEDHQPRNKPTSVPAGWKDVHSWSRSLAVISCVKFVTTFWKLLRNQSAKSVESMFNMLKLSLFININCDTIYKYISSTFMNISCHSKKLSNSLKSNPLSWSSLVLNMNISSFSYSGFLLSTQTSFTSSFRDLNTLSFTSSFFFFSLFSFYTFF